MKHLLTALFIFFGVALSAQTTMNIYQGNGTVLQIPLNSIDSITYTIGNPGNLATLTTLPVGSIGATGATSGGNISSDGGTPVTQRGVCWGMTSNPTTANSHTLDGNGTGSFTSAISGLQPEMTYYVRAFAINSAGIAYGNEVSFSTTQYSTPVIVTLPVSEVGPFTAMGHGIVQEEGDYPIVQRGVCWSTSPGPTTQDAHQAAGAGIGAYDVAMTEQLQPGSTYYVRAYGMSSTEIYYGNEVSFTTDTIELITNPAHEGGAYWHIICGGTILNSPDWSYFTSFGVEFWTPEWSVSSSDYVIDWGENSYSVEYGPFASNTTIYARAYVTWSGGIAYGNEIVFTNGSMGVITSPPSSIGFRTAIGGGAILNSTGFIGVGDYGLCLSTSPNPTIGSGSWIGSQLDSNSFTTTITDLEPATQYYARAYVQMEFYEIVYGNELTFQTDSIRLITAPVTNIESTTASSGGTVLNELDLDEIYHRGICWSTSPNPTTSDEQDWGGAGGGGGSFTSQLQNLEPNTTYYVRAFAEGLNSVGYGQQVSFTTAP